MLIIFTSCHDPDGNGFACNNHKIPPLQRICLRVTTPHFSRNTRYGSAKFIKAAHEFTALGKEAL